MWTKREAEWERERLARERLMAEVRNAFAYTVTTCTNTYTILVSYKCPAMGEPLMEIFMAYYVTIATIQPVKNTLTFSVAVLLSNFVMPRLS